MGLQQVDERQEQLPVQPILVELVGHHVGCRHQRHAMRKQLFEQPVQQHGIGDVMYVEFVEAQQLETRLDDGLDHRLDRIGIAALLALAEGGHPGVDLVHELMEMHPPLFGNRYDTEKQVHQHGLAAPHLAMEVKPAHRLRLAQQPAEKPFRPLSHDTLKHDVE